MSERRKTAEGVLKTARHDRKPSPSAFFCPSTLFDSFFWIRRLRFDQLLSQFPLGHLIDTMPLSQKFYPLPYRLFDDSLTTYSAHALFKSYFCPFSLFLCVRDLSIVFSIYIISNRILFWSCCATDCEISLRWTIFFGNTY